MPEKIGISHGFVVNIRWTRPWSTGNRSHRVPLLETICVSPVVFLAFAVWETPGSGAKQAKENGGGSPMLQRP